MHGRPRKASKPEEEAASAAKAVKLRSLQSQFMANHHDKMYNLLFSFQSDQFICQNFSTIYKILCSFTNHLLLYGSSGFFGF